MASELGVPATTVSGWISRGLVEVKNRLVTERGQEQLRKLAADRQKTGTAEEDAGELRQQLLTAQVRERNAISRLRELELEHESGRYVELAVVQRDAADTAERILAVLRAVPQRCAMALECSCRSAPVVEAKIGEEIERAIAELHESNPGGKT
jgi:phage terminase Nu1 subunit (DNA packaging protein)